MDLQSAKEWLGADWERVQEEISGALANDIDLLTYMIPAILSYSANQLRPVIALLIARACGKVNADTYRYAAAVELLHNATLLHDDVADESDTRRGKPTLNSLMGPSVSVLVGDFWLVRAVDCVLDAERTSGEITRLFAKTMGNLAEGEMLQLQKAETCDTDEGIYLRVIYNKTASLFETAALSAAISVDASDGVREAVRRAAVNLGLAFQIRDDILDYSLDASIGKPVGADILEKKITLPLLGALKNAGPQKEAEVREQVRTIDGNPQTRENICAFVQENGGMEYAWTRLDEYIAQALKELEALEDSEEKKMLEDVIRYIGRREI